MTRPLPLISGLAAVSLILCPLAQAQTPQALGRPVVQGPLNNRLDLTVRRPIVTTPTLEVNGGQTLPPLGGGGVSVYLGGVPGAVAYHVLNLDLGCDFDLAPTPGGLRAPHRRLLPEMFPPNTLRPRLTSDRNAQLIDNAFDPAQVRLSNLDGIATGANGKAFIGEAGSYGVWTRAPTGFRMDISQPVTNNGGYTDWMIGANPVTNDRTTCEPKGVVLWKMPDGIWRGIDDATGQDVPVSEIVRLRYTASRPFFLKAHQRIVVEETAKLEAWGLKATMTGASIGAVCDGKSWGPAGEHAVGVGRAQGDLTFTLRSGPVGNRCGVALTGYSLPAGVTIVSQTWGLSRVRDQCHLEASATLPQDVLAAALMGAWAVGAGVGGLVRWIVTGETEINMGFALSRLDYVRKPTRILAGDRQGGSVHGWRDPYAFGDPLPDGVPFAPILNKASPQVGLLECNPALSNDNAATLRLERVVLNVPAGEALGL